MFEMVVDIAMLNLNVCRRLYLHTAWYSCVSSLLTAQKGLLNLNSSLPNILYVLVLAMNKMSLPTSNTYANYRRYKKRIIAGL